MSQSDHDKAARTMEAMCHALENAESTEVVAKKLIEEISNQPEKFGCPKDPVTGERNMWQTEEGCACIIS